MDFYQTWSSWLESSASEFFQATASFMPKLIMAIVLIFFGWIVAKLLKSLILKLSTSLDKIVKDSHPQFHTKWPVSIMVGTASFWLIFLFFLSMSAETLGLPKLSSFLRQIFGYLPSFVAGASIIFIGYVLSHRAKDALRHSELEHGELFGQAAWLIILIFSVILGTAQLGLDTTLLVNLVTIMVAMLFGGAALAFGLGAGASVGNIMASHYLRKTYSPGQMLKVGSYIGKVDEIGSTTLVLDTAEGKVAIPAKLFNDTIIEQVEES